MPRPNPFASGEHQQDWQDGYAYGFDHGSDTDPRPPSEFDDEAAEAWLQGALAGRQDATSDEQPTQPEHQDPASNAGTSLDPTGAKPIEVPATFHMNGMPAFRYNLPTVPLATVDVDTGAATVSVAFGMRGSVTVTFQDPVKWASFDPALRLEAARALGGLTEGLRVSGLGSTTPSIGVTVGTSYETEEVRFTPPNTLSFIGQGKISYGWNSSSAGQITVQGQPGFELKVTVTPRIPSPVEPQTSEEFGGSESYGGVLATLGFLVLATIAIATAPETGGGSLVLLGI